MGERSSCESKISLKKTVPVRTSHHSSNRVSTSGGNAQRARTMRALRRHSSSEAAAMSLLSIRHQQNVNVDGSIAGESHEWNLAQEDFQSTASGEEMRSVNSGLFDEQSRRTDVRENKVGKRSSSNPAVVIRALKQPSMQPLSLTGRNAIAPANKLLMRPGSTASSGPISSASSACSNPQDSAASSPSGSNSTKRTNNRSSALFPQGTHPMPPPPALAKHLIHMTRPLKIELQ